MNIPDIVFVIAIAVLLIVCGILVDIVLGLSAELSAIEKFCKNLASNAITNHNDIDNLKTEINKLSVKVFEAQSDILSYKVNTINPVTKDLNTTTTKKAE